MRYMSHQLYFVSSPTASAFQLGSKTPCSILRRQGQIATVRTLDQLVLSVNVADLAPRQATDRQILDQYSTPQFMKLFIRIPGYFRPQERRFSPLNRLHFDPSFSSNYMLMRARNVQKLCTRQAVCYNLLHFVFDNVLVKIMQGGVFRCQCFVTGRVIAREDKGSMLLKFCSQYSQIFGLDAQQFFEQVSSDLRVVCGIKDKYEYLQIANQLARKICQFSTADYEQEQVIVIVSDGGDFSGFQLQAYENALKSCYMQTKSIQAVQFNASERQIEKALRAVLKEFFDQPYYDVVCSFADLAVDYLRGIMAYQRNYEMLAVSELYMGYYSKDAVIDYINKRVDGFWMDAEVFAAKKGQQLADDDAVPLSVQLMRYRAVERMPDVKAGKESYDLAKPLQERAFTPQLAEIRQTVAANNRKRRAASSLRRSQSNTFNGIDRVEINTQTINMQGSRLSSTPSPQRRRACSAAKGIALLDLGFLKKKSSPHAEQQEKQFFASFERLEAYTDEFRQKTAAASSLYIAVAAAAGGPAGHSNTLEEQYYKRQRAAVEVEVLPSPFDAALSKAEIKRKLFSVYLTECTGEPLEKTTGEALVVELAHYSPRVVAAAFAEANSEYAELRQPKACLEMPDLYLQIPLEKPRELPRTEKVAIGVIVSKPTTEAQARESLASEVYQGANCGRSRAGSISPLEQLAMESQTCCTEEVVAESAPDAKMPALEAPLLLEAAVQSADAVQCDEISGKAGQGANPVQYTQLDFRQFLSQHEYRSVLDDSVQGGSLAAVLRSGRSTVQRKAMYSGSVAYFSDLGASAVQSSNATASRAPRIDAGEQAMRESASELAKSELLSHIALAGKAMDFQSKYLAQYVTGKAESTYVLQEPSKSNESALVDNAAAVKSSAAPSGANYSYPETSLVSYLFEDFEKRKQARIDERKREKQQKEASKKSPTLSSFFSANNGAQSRHSSGAGRDSVSTAFDQEMSFSTYLNEYAKFLQAVELSKPPPASRASPSFQATNSTFSSVLERSGPRNNAETSVQGSTSFAKNVERMKQRLLASDRRPASVLSE